MPQIIDVIRKVKYSKTIWSTIAMVTGVGAANADVIQLSELQTASVTGLTIVILRVLQEWLIARSDKKNG